MASEHICAACPRAVGRSCCEVESRHDLATLTPGDIARIQTATGKSRAHFVDQEIFSLEEAHAHALRKPANAHAIRDGVREHLKARGGACVFHGARGCTLPDAARPLACRLYPLELDEFGQPRLGIAGRCHAEESLDGLPALLAAMGQTFESVRALHAQLCDELSEADR